MARDVVLPSSFGAIFPVGQCKHVTGLATQRLTELLQRLEVNSQSFALLQPPKRGVAKTRLLCQPVKSPLVCLQQVVNAYFDHYLFPDLHNI